MRKRDRRSYGERAACERCGQDIEWLGKANGWCDRGGGRECLPYRDRAGEIVTPRKGLKHRPY